MSRENVELIIAGMREFQTTYRATDATAPDFIWDMSALEKWPEAREYFGPEGFNEFMIRWTEAYDEFEMRFEDVIDAGGERVVTVLHQRGRPHGSQAWVDFRIVVVWTVAEGQVKRGQLFRTLEQALEAGALRE